MKKLLLTGFEGFLKYKVNPTEKIVKQLDQKKIGEFIVAGRVLPVEFQRSSPELIRLDEQIQPDAILSLGLVAGRNRITPERIAINCMGGSPDNSGRKPEDECIVPEGPAAYFSKLPIRQMASSLNKNGFPAEISNSAGIYLCNHVMYSALHKVHIESRKTTVGFVHIPASHELAVDHPDLPSWAENDLLKAVEILIGEI